MARKVDPVAHAMRRDMFVDVAIGLIQRVGYEQLSVQAVIDEAGASKGAFFHYFDSKAALLAAVVDRLVETAVGQVAPVAADPGLTALQKLQGLFAGIYRWKTQQPEFQPALVEEFARTWFSDENAMVIERMRAAVARRLTPMLVDILCQGASDGSFAITSPEGTASVLTSLIFDMNMTATRLYLGRRDGTVSYDTVVCTLGAHVEAFERILGIPPASWPILDDRVVRQWFG